MALRRSRYWNAENSGAFGINSRARAENSGAVCRRRGLLGAAPRCGTFWGDPQVCNPSAAPSNYGSAYRWACLGSMLEWFKVLKLPMLLFPLNEHSDSDKSVVIAQSDRHDRYTTTRILIDWVRFCNKSMMMQMELRDIDLKPVGNGNWKEIKKKLSNSDENCESDIDKREKFFL